MDVRASERDLEFPPDSLDAAEIGRRRERLRCVQQRLDAVTQWLDVQFGARLRVGTALVDPAVAAFLSTALHVGRHATDVFAPLVAQLPLCAEARADLAVSAAGAEAGAESRGRCPPHVVMPVDVEGAAKRQPLRLPSDSSFPVLHHFATLGQGTGSEHVPDMYSATAAGGGAGAVPASAAGGVAQGEQQVSGGASRSPPLCYARMAFAFAGAEADELQVAQGQAVDVLAASAQRTRVLVAAGATPREPSAEEGWAMVRVLTEGSGSRVGFVPEAYIDWERSSLCESDGSLAP